MSRQTTRLMVLGVIAYREPASGYGVEKTLDEWAVDRWTSIAPASIYQQLRTLSAGGLVEAATDSDAEDASSTGRATAYRCTPAGRTELHRLLLELLGERDIRPLSLIPLLYFTPSLSADELRQGLTDRITAIDEAIALEDAFVRRSEGIAPRHVHEIFRLTWHGLRADRRWCQEFLQRLGDPGQSAGPGRRGVNPVL